MAAGGGFAFLTHQSTSWPLHHIWAQPDLGGFILQWGLPSGGCSSAWETQCLALIAQGKHPKSCRDTQCPQHRALEHTYTAWADTYGSWAGWIPGKMCRQHCCTFGMVLVNHFARERGSVVHQACLDTPEGTHWTWPQVWLFRALLHCSSLLSRPCRTRAASRALWPGEPRADLGPLVTFMPSSYPFLKQAVIYGAILQHIR